MSLYFNIQSTLHIGIIMDGNGRWAQARNLPRTAGHREGVAAVSRVVEAAPDCGIGVLTLFAFSSDNWRRPTAEVEALMRLLHVYLERETPRSAREGVRIEVIGRRDRLEAPLRQAIARAERATEQGARLRLRIAVDYSARDAILEAASRLHEPSLDALSDALGPPVDLLIRTGGERRLSDFLLWESAYAELVFTRTLWPDFGASDLRAAVREFHARERRFGGIPAPVPPLRQAWLD
jgi:undecaprenyl diphosphate synthase